MRVCLATSGTRGDIFPFLALGRELRSRGHEAFLLTHPYFEPDVRAAGLDLEPLGAEFDLATMLEHPDLFHHRRGQPLVFRWVRDSVAPGVRSYRALLARRRPDLLVCHHFLLGGPQVCEAEGVPWVNACLAPCAWLARDDDPPAAQKTPGPLPRIGARALAPVVRPALRIIGDRLFAPALRRAGVEPGRGVFIQGCRGGPLNLGMWSHHFRPPCADDPPHGVITGFAWYDGPPGAALDDELERFLEAGEPPLVFAMGSAAHHTAGDFYETAAAACADLGVRAVLLTGDNTKGPRNPPPDVRCAGYAPFGLLFPRAAVTVHHGGIGSLAQALRAGRPTLVVPRAHDQFNNALHAERLGVGLSRPFHRLTRRGLVRTLQTLLHDEATEARAAALGERLAEEDGARVAADYLEAFADSERPLRAAREILTPPAAPGSAAPRR